MTTKPTALTWLPTCSSLRVWDARRRSPAPAKSWLRFLRGTGTTCQKVRIEEGRRQLPNCGTAELRIFKNYEVTTEAQRHRDFRVAAVFVLRTLAAANCYVVAGFQFGN